MEKKEKSEAAKLKEKLFYKVKNTGLTFSDEEIKKAMDYCEDYKDFLSHGKTEREATAFAVTEAEKHGFRPFDKSKKYECGSKIYAVNRGKSVILAVVGKKPLSEGVHVTAAHIDSPRLDLKQNPLFEDANIAQMKTHYYGGIKKYQWTTIPLALHGEVIKRDGTKMFVTLGDSEGEPQFCVTDLLPHLAHKQMDGTLRDAIDGEKLNVVVGCLPFRDDSESELVKLNILKLLNEKYGIVERDFISSELTMVPAANPTDIGFDRGFVGGYGHDDKVCAYPSLTAIFDCGVPDTTAVCILTDKEEIGSEGNTGMNSCYFPYFIADLARPYGLAGRDVLSRSKCLSADVSAAFDPNYPDVMEKMNAAFINGGVSLNKYTGAAGKHASSDASAEFTSEITALFDKENVAWQMSELGKVDAGGGGTVAKFIARLDVDVIDVGVPVLSMHSPFELVSKLDVYSTYRAMSVFYRA